MDAAITYAQTQNLLYKICRRFQAREGGTFENLYSIANERFMQAYQNFDKRKNVKFSSWLWNIVWYGLMDWKRQAAAEAIRFPKDCDANQDELPQTERFFCLAMFLGELSEESQEVVKTALNLFGAKRISDGFKQRAILVETLIEKGFSPKTVERSFNEIASSL